MRTLCLVAIFALSLSCAAAAGETDMPLFGSADQPPVQPLPLPGDGSAG